MISVNIKLVVFVLCITVLPVVAFGGFIYINSAQQGLDALENQLTSLNQHEANKISNTIQSYIREVELLSEDPTTAHIVESYTNNNSLSRETILEMDLQVLGDLQRAITKRPWLHGIIITDPLSKKPIFTIGTPFSFEHAIGLQHHRDAARGITSISPVFASLTPIPNEQGNLDIGIPTFYISTPVRTHSGIAGVLTARINLFELQPTTQEAFSSYQSIDTYLVDSSGVFLSPSAFENELLHNGTISKRSALELHTISPDGYYSPLFRLGRETNTTQTMLSTYRDYRGKNVIGVITPIAHAPWFLITELDYYEALEPLREIQAELLLALIIVATIISGAALVYTRSVTAPLQQLHQAAEQIGKRNFSIDLDIHTNDEFEELAHALNKTSSALSRMDAEHQEIESAKTRFLSITSHELRSPMTPMKAQLQMLQKGYFGKLDKKQADAISTILRNADRLDKIIVDFLEISRIEAGRLKFEFKKINVAELIEETVKLMQSYLPEKNVTITTHIKKLPTIESDPDRISQVLRNLLSNAKKFSPPNDTILLNAQHTRDGIQISVHDNGPGIPLDDQRRLFEPFYQAHKSLAREYGGTGLGLAISKGIITSQNGKIWLESTPGKGTTFSFTIPLQPVKDIKPIKLLFSPTEELDRKLQALFAKYLGPLSVLEFQRIQQQPTLPHLRNYVTHLQHSKILDKHTSAQFLNEIETLLKGERPIEEKIGELFT